VVAEGVRQRIPEASRGDPAGPGGGAVLIRRRDGGFPAVLLEGTKEFDQTPTIGHRIETSEVDQIELDWV
jgi:hypothetical protein